jgi:hypothetical protein
MARDTSAGLRACSPGEMVSDLSITARAIGIDEAALETALAGGETIADIARAHGVKSRQVVRALVSHVVASVGEDIQRGDLSPDQVTWLVALATWHAEQQVTRAFPSMEDLALHV